MDSVFKAQCPRCNVKLKLASRPADDKNLKCPSCRESFLGADLSLAVPKKESATTRSTKGLDSSPAKTPAGKSPPVSKTESIRNEQPDAFSSQDDHVDEEYLDDESLFEDDLKSYADAEDWNEEDVEEEMRLPPRSNTSSKTNASPKKAQSDSPKTTRRTILVAMGSLLGLGGIITVLIFLFSVATQSEYDKLYAEWYRLTYDYAEKQSPNASSSENAETARKMIETLQAKVRADGPFNILLPESQRKPRVKLNPETPLTVEEEAAELFDKEKLLKTLVEFGIEIPPWLAPGIDDFKSGRLTPLQEKLFMAVCWQTLFDQLA